MARTFAQENALQRIKPYWWIAIEGIRLRYGTYQPSWNPADSGTNRHIKRLLARVPKIGGQEADPLNGSCSIPSHQFSLADSDNEITDLVSVANTPKAVTFMTAKLAKGALTVKVADYADFDTAGDIYIDRETLRTSAKATDTQTGTADHTTGTADADPGGASDIRMHDDSRTEVNDYWAGALLTFTSGSNNGETRTVIRSTSSVGPLQTDENYNTLYLDPADPLPNNVTAADGYSLTDSPRRVTDATRAEDEDYWTGALFVVTDDGSNPENIGETRWVKSFVDGVFEFYEPLPTPASATLDFSVTVKSFTVTRGKYDSEDVTHEIVDEHGTPVPVDVVDKPRYLKTRRVWIYENRLPCAESEAKCRQGVITDWKIEPDGMTYTFDVSGLLSLLSKKVLYRQQRGQVGFKPVWGGKFKAWPYYDDSIPHGGQYKIGYWPIMDDMECVSFGICRIIYNADIPFVTPCNVKIDDEIIRVSDQETHFRSGQVIGFELVLSENNIDYANEFWHDAQDLEGCQSLITNDGLGLFARGLFAEKIGFYVRKPVQLPEEQQIAGNFLYQAKEVSGFIQEHEVGAEIIHVCLCDDSERSDFARYDFIRYSGAAGTPPAAGATITGSLSGATTTLMEYQGSTHLVVINTDGEFQIGDTLSSGGWSATYVSFDKGDGHGRPSRNNAINVLLQLLMSSGVTAANGTYDTLPIGWGLGLTTDDVDIDAIEDLRDNYFSHTNIDFVLHEPTSLKEWAEENIFRMLQVFPYETPTGKLSLGYLLTEAEAQFKDLTETLQQINGANISATALPDWTSGQMPISKVVIQHNKHPVSDDYFGKMEIVFARAKRYFGESGRTISINCPSLYLAGKLMTNLTPNNPELPDILRRIINPMWGRHGSNPCPIVQFNVPYNLTTLEIGQVIKFTHPSLPNLRTGTRGLTSEYFQILGSTPDPISGVVSLICWQIGVHDLRYGVQAPSAVVDHLHKNTPIVGRHTVELSAVNYFEKIGSSVKDHNAFIVDDYVMFVHSNYDLLGGAAPERFKILSIGTSSVLISGTMTFDPSAGDYMELAPYDDNSDTRQDTTFFLADENRTLGAASDTAYKYM